MSSRESEHSMLVVAWFVRELRCKKCVREAAAVGLAVAITPALIGSFKSELKSRLLF